VKKKLLFIILAALAVILILSGCSSSSSSKTSPGKYTIVRNATLGSKWQMYQMELNLPASSSFDIDLLNLGGTDKVEGYFYTEKGTAPSLDITAATNVLYQSAATSNGTTSDRFAFAATQPFGTAYILNFKNVGSDKLTIFLELIYPNTASLRGPIDLK
jgi:hypothetical protein